MRQRQTSTLITALIVLVGVALASVILAGMAGGFGSGGMMGGWYGSPYGMMSGAHGWLAMALGWLGMLAFVGAIVLAVVWAVRSLSSTDGRGAAGRPLKRCCSAGLAQERLRARSTSRCAGCWAGIPTRVQSNFRLYQLASYDEARRILEHAHHT